MLDIQLSMLRPMADAGVPILAGTDASNEIWVFAGHSLHRELELFVRAGLTPLEAIQTATLNPRMYAGHERANPIAVGEGADLVLFAADPTANIANLATIRGVVARGMYHDRASLNALLADARAQGARVLPVHPEAAAEDAAGGRRMGPVLLLDVNPRMAVMQEEIFGPLLPVLPYAGLDEAIAHVNANPRPLALYWFGKDAGNRERVLRETVSGGVTVNDALLHIAQENLPFGGVGASGTGAYHGEWGFRLFSHQKPVFEQSALAGSALVRPPYGRVTAAVMKLLRRLA
jgi:hypothetical protein